MWKDDLPPNRATTTEEANKEYPQKQEELYGYVPNALPPTEINPFLLIEGNENKMY